MTDEVRGETDIGALVHEEVKKCMVHGTGHEDKGLPGQLGGGYTFASRQRVAGRQDDAEYFLLDELSGQVRRKFRVVAYDEGNIEIDVKESLVKDFKIPPLDVKIDEFLSRNCRIWGGSDPNAVYISGKGSSSNFFINTID